MSSNGTTMTIEEMAAAYPGEWVLIADPELTSDLEVVAGRVVLHRPDKRDVWAKAAALKLEAAAVVQLGDGDEEPEDTGYLL